jgi:hypothetical protein
MGSNACKVEAKSSQHQGESMQPESAGSATTAIKTAPVRARFGSSEVPASRATQDRIDIPEFAAILEPEGEISRDRFLDRELSWLSCPSSPRTLTSSSWCASQA